MDDYSIVICKPQGKELPTGLLDKLREQGQDEFRIHVERDGVNCTVTPSECEDGLDGLEIHLKCGVDELKIPELVADFLGCAEYSEYFSFG